MPRNAPGTFSPGYHRLKFRRDDRWIARQFESAAFVKGCTYAKYYLAVDRFGSQIRAFLSRDPCEEGLLWHLSVSSAWS